jgi:hypothetical protein
MHNNKIALLASLDASAQIDTGFSNFLKEQNLTEAAIARLVDESAYTVEQNR